MKFYKTIVKTKKQIIYVCLYQYYFYIFVKQNIDKDTPPETYSMKIKALNNFSYQQFYKTIVKKNNI